MNLYQYSKFNMFISTRLKEKMLSYSFEAFSRLSFPF